LDGEHTYNGTQLTPVDHQVAWDAELTAAAAQVIASIMEWPTSVQRTAISGTLEAVAAFYDNKYADNPSRSALDAADRFRRAGQTEISGGKPTIRVAKELLTANSNGVEFTGDAASDWMRARAIVSSISGLSEIHNNVRFLRLFRVGDEIASELNDQWAQSGTYREARTIVRRALQMRQVMDVHSAPAGVSLMTLHKSKGKEFDGVVLVEGRYRSRFFDETHESPPFDATRRLLRVGITRARSRAVLVRPHGALALTSPST
jgi:DNA helicase-2/ATP-dependent DNA helicase PcrA